MRSFIAYPVTPYIGTFPVIPAKFCGPAFSSRVPDANLIPLDFNWTTYSKVGTIPNIGVEINVTLTGPSQIKQIVGCYIDNLASNVPVYVRFPDTGFTVVCQPGSVLTKNVITNSLTCFVYALGVQTTNIPSTRVFLSDQPFPNDFTEPEIPFVYSRGIVSSNTAARYRTVALADLYAHAQINLATGATAVILPAVPDTYIYISAVEALVVTALNASNTAPFLFLQNAAGAVLFNWTYIALAPPNDVYYAQQILARISGLNYQLPGNVDYSIASTAVVSQGLGIVNLYYTRSVIQE